MKKIIILVLSLVIASSAVLSAKDFRIIETKQGTSMVAGHAMVRLKEMPSGGSAQSASWDFTIVEPLLSATEATEAKRTLRPAVLAANQSELSMLEDRLTRTFVVEFDPKETPDEFCHRIVADCPDVEYAEPWYVAEIQYRPNDNLVDFQAMLANCKFFEAWDIYKGDPSIVIGISDNGIDQSHEDLAPNIAINTADPVDSIDNDGNGFIDDYNGFNFANSVDHQGYNNTYVENDHGTMTSGIAAAKTNNTKGIAGTGCFCSFFPMKTAEYDYPKRIVYGYKSLLYSAIRHFKVVSCSWGFPLKYSRFNQEIVRYVAANDVAIVVAGGNVRSVILQTNYPAGYTDLLSVGEVDQSDIISGSTTLGAHINVMAPGIGDYYTTFENGYLQETIGGTSVATPVVAGLVALVRGKNPTLNALQSLEIVRQATDDIRSVNVPYADIVPGRINAQRALQTDPNTIPGLRPQSMQFIGRSGNPVVRYDVGDTVRLRFQMKNHLAAAKNVRFVLSFAQDAKSSLQAVESTVVVPSIAASSLFDLGDFSFVLKNRSSDKAFIRVDIYGENGYKDFFLMSIYPYNEMRTLANSTVMASFGDRGNFGYSPDLYEYVGEGFSYKNIGTTLDKGGLFVTADYTQAVSSLFSERDDNNDFAIEKPFLEPYENQAIFTDANAYEEFAIGVRVHQDISIGSDGKGYVKIINQIQNTGITRNLLAASYYVDFDMSNVDSNRTSLFPEAIPESYAAMPASAELIESSDPDWPFVGVAAFAGNEHPARAFTAGIDRRTNFSIDQLCDIVATGSNTQSELWRDVAVAAGVEFSGTIEKDSQRTCAVCFAAAATKSELAALLQDCILSGTYISAREDAPSAQVDFAVLPQPAQAHSSLVITGTEGGPARLEVIDMLGNSAIVKNDLQLGKEYSNVPLDLSSLAPGVYILKLTINGNSLVKKIILQ